MGNYSNDSDSVRVDFFKPGTNTWYTTEAVKWRGSSFKIFRGSKAPILEEFAESILIHLQYTSSPDDPDIENVRLGDMVAVCLEPYHPNSCPLMLEVSKMSEMLKAKDQKAEDTRLKFLVYSEKQSSDRRAEDSYNEQQAEEGYQAHLSNLDRS